MEYCVVKKAALESYCHGLNPDSAISSKLLKFSESSFPYRTMGVDSSTLESCYESQ